jgi:cardiolipin synthase A/B
VRDARRWRGSAAALVLLVASGCLPPTAATADLDPPPPSPAVSFSGPSEGVRIIRVYANAARDNEFVELANVARTSVDLSAWSLSDLEATVTFPLDSILPAGGRTVITRNATSYAEDTLEEAGFAWEEGAARRMEGGALRLADAGDEVLLSDASVSIVDAYVWGDSSYGGPGWTGRPAERTGRGEVAVRGHDAEGGWSDRDTAEDWEGPRSYRLGQSSFDLETFDVRGPVSAVLSPDDGDAPLLRFLGSAETTIEVGVYTLTSERIASVLADAAGRGVAVRVLLDGGPVGGIEEEERLLVGSLLASGVEVRWLAGGSDVVKRYRYLHAKYAVVDGRAGWVGSENFGDAGFPPQGEGNRGWSVVLEDDSVAGALRAVFEHDFDVRRKDSTPAAEPLLRTLPLAARIVQPPLEAAAPGRRVGLVIGPDTSLDPGGPIGLFASALQRLSIQAFYMDETWGHASNPFLEAAFAAARRGVDVRILLDGSWSSVADVGTNDDVLFRINDRARDEGVSLEVRLLDPQGPVERLHNKGAVADGRLVLVSSMNWALGSATQNREIGVILEDAGIASRFEAAFDADWDGRATSGADAWRLDDPLALAALYLFVAAASAISLRKLRVGGKGISPGARVRTRASHRPHFRRGSGEVRLLPPELVAEPRPRPRTGRGARGGRPAARRRLRGPEGDYRTRGPGPGG